MSNPDYLTKKCPCCGRTFDYYPNWAYKLTINSRYTFFCTWKCLRTFEQAKPKKYKIDRGVPKKANMRFV